MTERQLREIEASTKVCRRLYEGIPVETVEELVAEVRRLREELRWFKNMRKKGEEGR